jgi:proteasome lid subunit RPN8/RPN11
VIPPFHCVRVDTGAERAFRKRALSALPNEHMETLWGNVTGHVANIHVFMPLQHSSTPESVTYNDTEIAAQRREARKYDLEYLGSIHTHPDRNEVLFSEPDLRELQKNYEAIMGICAIENLPSGRRRLRIAYWPGVLPFQVEYTKATGLWRPKV